MELRALFVAALLFACTGGSNAVNRAVLLADKGQTHAAVEILERELSEHPQAVAERRLLVRLYGSLGQLGKARAHSAALEKRLGPASPVPWLELGHALELAHRYEEALHAYDQASVVAPRDSSGPRTGGLRAAVWGELNEAEPRLAEAVRRDPSDARTWHALGVVRVKQGDLAGAERAYRAGVQGDPALVDNRVGLATLALVRDDPAQVLREYEAILRLRPQFADAHLGRSWALIRLRRFPEAVTALERAERLGADRSSLSKQREWLATEQVKSARSR